MTPSLAVSAASNKAAAPLCFPGPLPAAPTSALLVLGCWPDLLADEPRLHFCWPVEERSGRNFSCCPFLEEGHGEGIVLLTTILIHQGALRGYKVLLAKAGRWSPDQSGE